MDVIGRHIIQAPKKAFLAFDDGCALAQEHIEPIQVAFLKRLFKIVFAIPYDRSRLLNGDISKGATMGLFLARSMAARYDIPLDISSNAKNGTICKLIFPAEQLTDNKGYE